MQGLLKLYAKQIQIEFDGRTCFLPWTSNSSIRGRYIHIPNKIYQETHQEIWNGNAKSIEIPMSPSWSLDKDKG